MAQDLLYYVRKISTDIGGNKYWKLNQIGEVQETFNMSIGLDGSKDTCHFTVIAYKEIELDPFTIIYHEKTNTWWCLDNKKVTRYKNESGSMYVYELQCVGAIELFNARDLTNCGFRSNKYTIDTLIKRLFTLSNFEMPISINYGTLDSNIVIDYMKTFENYTLLSALREFLNGYNCDVKLSFNTYTQALGTFVSSAVLNIHSKSGNTSVVVDIDDFDDVREQKTMSKNSFGGKVISNAENVVSSKVSRFPATGLIGLSSNIRTVVDSNGDIKEESFIRLPSNAYKVNKVSIVANTFRLVGPGGAMIEEFNTCAYNEYNFKIQFAHIVEGTRSSYGDEAAEYVSDHYDEIYENVKKATTFEFYDGFQYDPVADEFKFPLNAPSGMKLIEFNNPAPNINRKIILTDKAVRDTLNLPYQGIYWERGSNLIKGFEYFGLDTYTKKQVDISYSVLGSQVIFSLEAGGQTRYITLTGVGTVNELTVDPYYISCFVEYIPMGDLKIITDNELKNRDIQLYNQNGKMNDSVGLSKLINSYANEVTSENITRYKQFYSLDDIIPIGAIVKNGTQQYVINNMSLDFYQNETNYKIEVEYTMSKYVATKSLMINANSNIRDYGIPQTENVRRIQVYKDTYALTYTQVGFTAYDPLQDMLSFPNIPTGNKQYSCFIMCEANYPTYTAGTETPTGTTSYYYYFLNTTKYLLKKQVIVKLDFNDNNIIGYDCQNIASNWSTNNFLLMKSERINTPVSYVDEVGELKGIYINFCDEEGTSKAITEYANDYLTDRDIDLFHNVVFIPKEMYDNATDYRSFRLIESQYYKDALETPVFEYSMQLINSEQVIVGENIFDTYDEYSYLHYIFYAFAYINDEAVTENSAMQYATNDVYIDIIIPTLDNTAKLNVGANSINIQLFGSSRIFAGAVVNASRQTIQANKTIGIYRYVYDFNNLTTIKKELLFVIKDLPSANIIDNEIVLYINRKE